MKIIGITGGVGSGKSGVLSLLKKKYGAYILEADKLAHVLMQPEGPTYHPIIDCFGVEIVASDGSIDRKKLGAIVFHDADKLERLNAITHPAVRTEINRRIAAASQTGGYTYFALEAALLLEEGYDAVCDEIWYIYVDPETRIQRLMAGRGYSREQCISIFESQSDDSYYRSHSRYVIDNSKDFENTELQIDNLLKK